MESCSEGSERGWVDARVSGVNSDHSCNSEGITLHRASGRMHTSVIIEAVKERSLNEVGEDVCPHESAEFHRHQLRNCTDNYTITE